MLHSQPVHTLPQRLLVLRWLKPTFSFGTVGPTISNQTAPRRLRAGCADVLLTTANP